MRRSKHGVRRESASRRRTVAAGTRAGFRIAVRSRRPLPDARSHTLRLRNHCAGSVRAAARAHGRRAGIQIAARRSPDTIRSEPGSSPQSSTTCQTLVECHDGGHTAGDVVNQGKRTTVPARRVGIEDQVVDTGGRCRPSRDHHLGAAGDRKIATDQAAVVDVCNRSRCRRKRLHSSACSSGSGCRPSASSTDRPHPSRCSVWCSWPGGYPTLGS